jgi:hypothetical protein
MILLTNDAPIFSALAISSKHPYVRSPVIVATETPLAIALIIVLSMVAIGAGLP